MRPLCLPNRGNPRLLQRPDCVLRRHLGDHDLLPHLRDAEEEAGRGPAHVPEQRDGERSVGLPGPDAGGGFFKGLRVLHSLPARYGLTHPSLGQHCDECPAVYVLGTNFSLLCFVSAEVIRTRLREEGSKYKYFFQTGRLIAVEEGYAAFYRGLVPQLIRQIPNTAIVLSTYELIVHLLGDSKWRGIFQIEVKRDLRKDWEHRDSVELWQFGLLSKEWNTLF